MVVLDARVRGKSLLCVVILHLFLVLAQETRFRRRSLLQHRERNLTCERESGSRALDVNKQIIVSLAAERVQVYYFRNAETYEEHTLSVTIVPCSSRVKWSFLYDDDDDDPDTSGVAKERIGEGEDDEMRTIVAAKARRGCYFLLLTPVDGGSDVRVALYLTMDDGGPYELTIPQKANLELVPQKKQKLKITWMRSLINPHNTSYCIVVSRKKKFAALCSAEEEGGDVVRNFGEDAWLNMNTLEKVVAAGRRGGNSTAVERRRSPKSSVIVCVDQKLQLTLVKMKNKETYHFTLFAINHKTNFTVPYGHANIKYSYRARPIALQDGKRRIVDLKKHNGEVFFKFKAYKKAREIHFYVLVCGGTVEAAFARKDRKDKTPDWSHANRTRVFGYKRFKFKLPGDYFLKISVPDTDERTRVEYVEVFATMHPAARYPLPALPEDLSLFEYRSRRSCNSITIGWIPEVDTTVNKYCVTVRENKRINLADKFRASFQCHLGGKSGKGFASFPSKYNATLYVYRKCKKQITKKVSVTNHTITNLKPGKSYTIQVTVEKKNGRTLSYKLLKAVTKHSCDV